MLKADTKQLVVLGSLSVLVAAGTGCGSDSPSFFATRRVKMSVPAPGEKGTMMRTALAG